MYSTNVLLGTEVSKCLQLMKLRHFRREDSPIIAVCGIMYELSSRRASDSPEIQ